MVVWYSSVAAVPVDVVVYFKTTVSLPEVALLPDQYPDAMQDDVLELFQEITIESPCMTVVELAEIETVARLLVVVEGLTSGLPPPPPPHAVSISIIVIQTVIILFIC